MTKKQPLTGNDRKRHESIIPRLQPALTWTEQECYILTGYIGRPMARWREAGKVIPASRLAWILAHGDPGDDVWVLHTCNNGQQGCVAVNHLYLGNSKQNVADQFKAGNRGPGSQHPNAKLTEADVLDIRARYVKSVGSRRGNTRELNEQYGMKSNTLWQIVTRRSWKHI